MILARHLTRRDQLQYLHNRTDLLDRLLLLYEIFWHAVFFLEGLIVRLGSLSTEKGF